ncbi:hypothetical protein PG985_005689 [Apiospora marii]|uniref:uncharacterized protein n=1 Tax=Apiospora marii TaxID=335849 RepID=UPI00312FA2C9
MGSMKFSMAHRSQDLPIPTPTGRHNPLCSQDTSSTMSKTRETNFRLPDEWEAQEILDEKVVGEKTYYLISWKPTLVPEAEISTTLLQAWRDEMDSLVPSNHSVLESHVVLQRCDQWLGTIIGEEVVDGAIYYRVQWEPTFEPDSNLVDMAKLLQEWKLKFRTRSGRLYTERSRVGIRKKPCQGRSPKRRDENNTPKLRQDLDAQTRESASSATEQTLRTGCCGLYEAVA